MPLAILVKTQAAYCLHRSRSLSVACNRFHSVERRLACWLLMMWDRAQTDEFKFTQELITDDRGAPPAHLDGRRQPI
jgi:hypothetical protein